MKVVQLFLAIMTDRSRPAGKIKLKFKNFLTGNPGPDRTGNPWPRPEGLPIGPRNPWPWLEGCLPLATVMGPG